MIAQRLDRTLIAWRIGDPDGRFPIMDPRGSTLAPGRWNTARGAMLYLSEHYSTAMLEKLVHGSGALPPNQHFVRVTIDASASFEVFSTAHHPGWDAFVPLATQAYGAKWLAEGRSLLLLVPSVVARPERNVLVNPAHAEFPSKLRWDLPEPVYWDDRLFARD